MEKERQLEEQLEAIARKTEEFEIPQSPPLFELYTVLVSLSFAVLMFLAPDLLIGQSSMTDEMMKIMPVHGWGIALMLAGIVGAVGILTNSRPFRYLGLSLKTVIFGTVTVLYYQTLPNFGFVILTWFTLFCVIAIPFVKYSGLSYKKRKKDEGNTNQNEYRRIS